MADLDLTNFQGFLDYEGLEYYDDKSEARTDEKIAVETKRATSAENTLTTNLNAEISRAENAESNLDSKKIDKTTVATSSTLGLIKSGTDITVDSSGNVSIKDDSHNHIISNVDGLQSALDGKAPTSHGTHVTYGTTTPKVAGTGAVGTETGLARIDHVHPAQTTVSGNSGSATKLATARTIDGVSFNGTAAITHYGTCSTAAGTAAKTVDLTGFSLVTGARVMVKFTVTNTASSPTLNVNSTGAKAIMYRGSAISAGYLAANRVYEFVYDGTDWEFIGDINTDSNTTYSQATSSKLGLVKIGYTESGKNYPVELNDSGQMFVNVPWTDNNTVYTHPSYTAKSSGFYKVTVDATGHVSGTTAVTKADITGLGIPSSDTTYSAFVKSGSGAKAGLVPAPSTTAGSTKYLCENGTWAVPTTSYTLPTASSTLGGVKTTSTVTSTSGLTACPIIDGVVYYKDTNTTYTHPTSGVTAGTYRSVTVDANGHVTAGSNPTITVAQGGTGKTTLTSGYALIGNGTSAVSLRAITSTPSSGSTSLFTAGGAYTQLSTKLNTSSVVTALDSTSTTNALAASAGKNLQDQITALNSDLDNRFELLLQSVEIDAISTATQKHPNSRLIMLNREVPVNTLFFLAWNHNKDWVTWNFVASSSMTSSSLTRDSIWVNVTNDYADTLSGVLYITGLIFN